jgi:hypothetical protein
LGSALTVVMIDATTLMMIGPRVMTWVRGRVACGG